VTPRPFLAAAGLLGLLAAPALAQGGAEPEFSWAQQGVEFSACVEFLMEPEMAAKQLSDGFVAVPAANFAQLSPVLQREIQGDAVHAAWIPARVCLIEAPGISAGGRVMTPEKKMGPREVLGFWIFAASRTEGDYRRDQWYAAQFWTNDWHVQRATEQAFIPMSTFKPSLEAVPESNRHSYEVKIGKTILAWDGELVGRDSAESVQRVEAQLILDGKRRISWQGALSMQTRWMRYLPGTFRVQGKDDLAKALKASPIRMFGPMYWGGDARVDFSRGAPSGGSGSGR